MPYLRGGLEVPLDGGGQVLVSAHAREQTQRQVVLRLQTERKTRERERERAVGGGGERSIITQDRAGSKITRSKERAG